MLGLLQASLCLMKSILCIYRSVLNLATDRATALVTLLLDLIELD